MKKMNAEMQRRREEPVRDSLSLRYSASLRLCVEKFFDE
jgi:hypothetical protein